MYREPAAIADSGYENQKKQQTQNGVRQPQPIPRQTPTKSYFATVPFWSTGARTFFSECGLRPTTPRAGLMQVVSVSHRDRVERLVLARDGQPTADGCLAREVSACLGERGGRATVENTARQAGRRGRERQQPNIKKFSTGSRLAPGRNEQGEESPDAQSPSCRRLSWPGEV